MDGYVMVRGKKRQTLPIFGRQISPGQFSGNAVKSPDTPGFLPEIRKISGAVCGRTHTAT
jgi:hypothetical protein